MSKTPRLAATTLKALRFGCFFLAGAAAEAWASAFPIAKTFLLINQNKAGKKITLEQISASQVKIFTLTDAGVNENNVLNLTSIEIRVYN